MLALNDASVWKDEAQLVLVEGAHYPSHMSVRRVFDGFDEGTYTPCIMSAPHGRVDLGDEAANGWVLVSACVAETDDQRRAFDLAFLPPGERVGDIGDFDLPVGVHRSVYVRVSHDGRWEYRWVPDGAAPDLPVAELPEVDPAYLGMILDVAAPHILRSSESYAALEGQSAINLDEFVRELHTLLETGLLQDDAWYTPIPGWGTMHWAEMKQDGLVVSFGAHYLTLEREVQWERPRPAVHGSTIRQWFDPDLSAFRRVDIQHELESWFRLTDSVIQRTLFAVSETPLIRQLAGMMFGFQPLDSALIGRFEYEQMRDPDVSVGDEIVRLQQRLIEGDAAMRKFSLLR